jgi:poly(3-hydroxybutyrate) depolymerase
VRHVGSYRLTDGRLVDISPDDDGTLQWEQFDGVAGELHKAPNGDWKSTYGWTGREDGKTVRFSKCGAGRIDFAGVSGTRIAFEMKETSFKSHDITLAGRLVLPQGTGKVAVVVFVHGSEDDSALNDWPLQRMLPAEGVGMFVYDSAAPESPEGLIRRTSTSWRTMRSPRSTKHGAWRAHG